VPRYPFVYINEYLQEIPAPLFNDTAAINSLDGTILLLLLSISLLGCAMMMYKMNVLFCQSASSCTCVWGSGRVALDHLESPYGNDSGEKRKLFSKEDEYEVARPSSSPRGVGGGTMSRLWGFMSWSKPPPRLYDHGFQRSPHKTIISAHSRHVYDESEGEDDHEATGLMENETM